MAEWETVVLINILTTFNNEIILRDSYGGNKVIPENTDLDLEIKKTIRKWV
jgi:hypothetical protein